MSGEHPISPAAGWYPDPHGVHAYRYFNGTEWTADGADYPPAEPYRVPGAVKVIAWMTALITVAYMFPWAVAAQRNLSNQAAIGLLNLLLGWTLIGWLVALVMACRNAPETRSP